MFGASGNGFARGDAPVANPWRDDELTRLLEEIPRATSAPPHLQERFALNDAFALNQRNTPIENQVADFRYDEDYARFYDLYCGQKKLPPPVDGRTLYQELPGLFQRGAPNPQGNGMLGNASAGHLNRSGLEVIDEQQGLNVGGTGSGMTDKSLIQAFQQLGVRGPSPLPPGHFSVPGGLSPVGSKPGTPLPFEGTMSAMSNGQIGGLPGPQLPQLGLPGSHLGLPGGPLNPGLGPGLNPALNPISHIEFQAAYQAAYQAALIQTQQALLMGQANGTQAGLSGLPLSPSVDSVQIAAAHLGLPALYPNATAMSAAAAAAAAAAAVNAASQMMSNPLRSVSLDRDGRRGGQQMGGPRQGQNNINGVSSMGGERRHDRDATHGDRRAGSGREAGNQGHQHHHHHHQHHREPLHHQSHHALHNQHNHHNQHNQQLGGANSHLNGSPMSALNGGDDGIASKFQNLEEVVGQLMSVAQDQNGCRFLQRKFDEGGPIAVAVVFQEVLDNVVELMVDPFGNYLVQKLLDRCSEQQRLEVLTKVAGLKQLVPVALNMHGTRAVQKLIETLSGREQKEIVIEALKDGVVSLIKDLNGNHVVQRCLQRLGPTDSQFIYDAAGEHCVEIATHRHGCCVLQRCVDYATPAQKTALVEKIAGNSLVLSQDAFGNYVVQYILELGHAEASGAVIRTLLGNIAELSMQKFSSNVVEKCLKLSGVDGEREALIREIMTSPQLPRVLGDAYGNYVVQSILTITSGAMHQFVVDAIRPHVSTLRGTPHGKRILQRVGGVKP